MVVVFLGVETATRVVVAVDDVPGDGRVIRARRGILDILIRW